MSKFVMFLFFGTLWGGFVEAQTNDRIDELLGQSPAHLDAASYLVLAAIHAVPEEASASEAFAKALGMGLWGTTRQASDGVSVQDLSFLLMKALKVSGGLEWSLLPNSRSAYRELAYLSLINTSDGPDRPVAGDEVIRTLGAVQAYLEAHR